MDQRGLLDTQIRPITTVLERDGLRVHATPNELLDLRRVHVGDVDPTLALTVALPALFAPRSLLVPSVVNPFYAHVHTLRFEREHVNPIRPE